MLVRLWAVALCLAVCAVEAPPAAAAEDYPSKPVRIVRPFPPGGASEPFVRLFSDFMRQKFGQPFVIDYRPGGTGIIGTTQVANAPADGYTLLYAPASSHVLAPLLRDPPPYDPLKTFTPVGMVMAFPFYLLVNPALPVKSVSDLVALAKARPGQLNYASIGIGSGNHLVTELFKNKAGIDAVHVPYAGVAATHKALVAGEVQFMFDSIGPARPLVEAGRERGLAITGTQRSPLLPTTPTMAEAGFSGFELVMWHGVYAPAGLPPDILRKLEQAVVEFVQVPEVRKRIEDFGATPAGIGSKAFSERIARDQAMWNDIIVTNKITLKN